METVEYHDGAEREDRDQESKGAIDPGMTKDFAYEFVLRDLLPIRTVGKKGCMRFLQKHVKKRVGGRRMVRRSVREWYRSGKQAVKQKILKAKDNKCRFGLSMATWKSKGICKRSFAGLIGRWISETWAIEEVCLGMPEMPSRKPAVDLQATASEVLAEMSITPEDAISFTTDHEQAQRNAVKSLADVAVGCACHGIQLPPRHVLPAVRQKTYAALSEAEDSSTESSSDDESVEDADEDEDEPDTVEAPPKDAHQEERKAITELLTPLFKKARHIVKWMLRNPDVYNEFWKVCEQGGWKWK